LLYVWIVQHIGAWKSYKLELTSEILGVG
jgi:hypothetical protein